MRIIAGTYRGRRLQSAPGRHTRPTGDRVREAVFNILGHEIVGARVLDLFAGTGALALEAISRGAASAVCIDNHPPAVAAIRENIHRLDVADRVQVKRWDACGDLRRLAVHGGAFTVVFLDPPYAEGLIAGTLSRLAESDLLEEDALVVVEHGRRGSPLDNHPAFTQVDERRYGKTLVTFLRRMV